MARHPIPTVGALVRGPSGRVLVVRTTKWRGRWGVPGGKVEWGERLVDALLREFREEVGLALERVEWALFQEAVFPPDFHEPMHFLMFNYFAESPTEEVAPNEEIVEWAWVPPREALDYPLNVHTTPLVERYLEVKGG